MPAKWDDETEKTMLLALLHLNPPANPSYAKIAGMIGSDFTAESVRYNLSLQHDLRTMLTMAQSEVPEVQKG